MPSHLLQTGQCTLKQGMLGARLGQVRILNETEQVRARKQMDVKVASYQSIQVAQSND